MTQESKASFTKRMKSISIPEGFTAQMGEETYNWGGKEVTYLKYTLTKPDDIKIEFDLDGCGHTRYMVDDFWASFDRLGVSDSFYHAPRDYDADKKNPIDLNKIVTEELAKITKQREYNKTAIKIPGIPFTTSPEGVDKLKEQLKKSGHITFTPSGFGTGYCLTKKPTRNCQWGEMRAKGETERFFGISPLYVHTLDCD